MNALPKPRAGLKAAAVAVCALSLSLSLKAAEALKLSRSEAEALFVEKIRPLFKEKCLACHGDDEKKLKAEFDMRTLPGLLKGGESGVPGLVPGDPEKSPIYVSVTWRDEDLEMPPKENDRLKPEQIERIRQWIAAGAPWSDAVKAGQWSDEPNKDGVQVRTSGGLSDDWTYRRYKPEDLWAYRPLKTVIRDQKAGGANQSRDARRQNLNTDSPNTDYSSSSNPIDAFIDRRLKEAGLQPAPPADRRTLIRRATFDLTGLPPTPKEVDDFVEDPAPEEKAFAKAVDRLLASPHYGEQWGRHWLDVVRYADSSGFANDYDRGSTWRYRDYVVRAFNDDKPYDRFIREQIAGDEIDPTNPENLVAVGFLRMGPWELTGMEVAAIARQRFLDDAVNSVGQAFLGQILACTKCHDHKFDPIPTRDYYSLYAAFATTQLADRNADFLASENTAGFEEEAYLKERRAYFQAIQDELNRKRVASAKKWCEERGLPFLTRAQGMKKGVPSEQLPPKNVGFTPEDFGLERISRKGIARIDWELDRYRPVAFSVYAGATPQVTSVNSPMRMPKNPMKAGKMEESHILRTGDVFSKADPVTPGALSVLEQFIPALRDVKLPATPKGRRNALADWIAHPENALTLRTIANRVWQWHFGQPLAANPNNFGSTGAKPTHPELLDWLAATFRDDGWSFKKLHRRIMLSEAYRRSSAHPDPKALAEKDSKGQSYAAFLPRRMTSEELRDSMLAASGELNRALGGIPNRPEMNLEAALQPRMVMGTFAASWQPNPKPKQRHRRSLYALKIRGLRDPFMEVFNEPAPDLSCEAREASSVTPQVFSLFNSQISLDRAVAFAARLQRETKNRNQAVTRAFRLVYGRAPDQEERKACLDHWTLMTKRHENLKAPRPEYPVEVVRDAVEENTGERFSFTEKLEMYEDFAPDKKLADVDPGTRGLAEVCLVLFNSNEFIYVY